MSITMNRIAGVPPVFPAALCPDAPAKQIDQSNHVWAGRHEARFQPGCPASIAALAASYESADQAISARSSPPSYGAPSGLLSYGLSSRDRTRRLGDPHWSARSTSLVCSGILRWGTEGQSVKYLPILVLGSGSRLLRLTERRYGARMPPISAPAPAGSGLCCVNQGCEDVDLDWHYASGR